jgi:predicted phosphodiesterase
MKTKHPSATGVISVAIMSDLHCHPADPTGQRVDESFLKVQSLRKPVTHHPIEAVLDLIRREPLRAVVLLAPGDFGNKASFEGLSYGWDVALEVGNALGAHRVIPVLGNHDVDSRSLYNSDAVYAARYLRPGFPFASSEACQEFFADGFCVIPVGSGLEVVVINTVVDHTDATTAKRGSFSIERIARLHEKLSFPKSGVIRIALMHHHPTLHSSPFLNEFDVIPGGDELLKVLRGKGCTFVVHGHKHQCRLTYADTIEGKIPVFAAGSFSAMLGEIASISRNLFHVVTLQRRQSVEMPLRGVIKSWEWAKGKGWVPARLFPFKIGFGRTTPLDVIVQNISKLVAARRSKSLVGERDLLKVADDLPFLTEPDIGIVTGELLSKHRIELRTNESHEFEAGALTESRAVVPR